MITFPFESVEGLLAPYDKTDLRDLSKQCAGIPGDYLFDDIYNTGIPEAKAAADAFLVKHANRIVHHEVLPTHLGLMVIKLAP